MKIIRPIPVTDAILTSTDVPESDYSAYAGGTTYALGDRVIDTTAHRIYESAQAANVGHALTDVLWWLDVGPTNRWRMFDGGVSTQTSQADGFEVVLSPGRFDSLALLNINASTYQAVVTSGVDVVYDTGVVSVEAAAVGDWYQYFFEPIITISDVTLTDIPPYTDAELTVTIDAPGSTAKLGMLIVGNYRDIGDTLSQPRVSIKDYSVKNTDDFGNTTIVERAFSKRLSANVLIANVLIDETVRLLSAYRAVAVVWIGTPEFTSTIIFGYFSSFEFVVEHVEAPPKSTYQLDIEGLT